MGTRSPGRYRFGVFEADVATGELRRSGLRLRLQSQPFQILLLLLERPGQLLTREQIVAELWPEGTFVDYEHGVTSAVNRIREALGDRASNPRFIETLARRGYRFLAPVQWIAGPDDLAEPAVSGPEVQPVCEETVLPRSSPPVLEPGQRRRALLASPADLPQASPVVVQVLFLALQVMYLAFYVSALAHLQEIAALLALASSSVWLLGTVLVSAALLIPVRVFLISAAMFRPPHFADRFTRMWPFLLCADALWSLSPFLLLHHISFGLALACTAVLVYSPFAQRALVLMGAAQNPTASLP